MVTTSDIFIERALLKKKLNAWRIFAVIAILLLSINFFNKTAKMPIIVGDYVARITIDDVVYDDKKLYELFEQVHNDSNAKALIVELDTPGGVAVAGEEIFNKINMVKQQKPVIAVMRSVCASAGYMIAMAADYVVAMKGTITGSIGVLMQAAEVSKLAEKIGVTPITIRSGALKGNPSMVEPISDKSKQALQKMIDDMHSHFIMMVAKSRNIPVDKVRKIADGRVYSSNDALKLNLIDAIGNEQEAMVWLKNNKSVDAGLPIVDIEIKKGFDDKFAEITGLSELFMLNKNKISGLTLMWEHNF